MATEVIIILLLLLIVLWFTSRQESFYSAGSAQRKLQTRTDEDDIGGRELDNSETKYIDKILRRERRQYTLG